MDIGPWSRPLKQGYNVLPASQSAGVYLDRANGRRKNKDWLTCLAKKL